MTSPITIDLLTNPPDDLCAAINLGLHEHNLSVLGPEVIYTYAKIAMIARDENGALLGGLIAQLIWGAMKIDTLWVDPAQRGQHIGLQLVERAEADARARGAALMLLETTSFQARGFYEKLGFAVYGQIVDYPKGHTWYHMKKELSNIGT